MSRDKLEQFIRESREEFDEFEPDPALFDGIKTRKPAISMVRWNSVVWKAAAAVAIFVASYFFHDWVNISSPSEIAMATDEREAPSEIFKMLVEAEMYYTSQINVKREEFYLLTANSPEIQREINYELVELDSVYADLKRDLKDNAANEEVISAMIQNYRIKLDILEDVLQQMQDAKNIENKKEESHEVEL